MLIWLSLILAALVGLFLVLSGNPDSLGGTLGGVEPGMMVYAVALAAYAVLLFSTRGGRIGQSLRYLAIWAGLALVLVAAYAYRVEFSEVANRVVGELAPPGQSVTLESDAGGPRTVRIRQRGDGHFAARAEVNAAAILTMMIDTGASTVVLKATDAQRVGIDTGALAFSIPVQTANGPTYAAATRLRSISIGGIEVRDVDALVAKPGSLNESLLGMSFLRRLRSYEISGEFLTLRS
ncbi:MAG: TIGR02281 family clan AA aspartic protease [Pseudomonadota bacterium]